MAQNRDQLNTGSIYILVAVHVLNPNNCQRTLRNIPEERRLKLYRGGRL